MRVSEPLVSVIIPVFRAEHFIEKCSRSLFEQSLQSIEFIFVNDATEDDSVRKIESVLKDYPNRKPYVNIINLQENGGVAHARMIGMKAAKGTYIIHCDSDDWVEENMYKEMYVYAVENKLDVCFCDYWKNNGHNKTDVKSKVGYGELDKNLLINELLLGNFHGSLCRSLINRDVLDNEIIYPTGNMCEDIALLMQILFYSKRVGWMDKVYYNYFYNNQSITKKKAKKADLNKFIQRKKNVDTMLQFANEHSIEDQYRGGLLMQQFYCKRYLFPYLWDCKVCKLYSETYPDMETDLYRCRDISCHYKIIISFKKMGIMPIIYRIKKGLY